MQFPTGGIAREPYGMIRLESGADSHSLDGRNWMEETGWKKPADFYKFVFCEGYALRSDGLRAFYFSFLSQVLAYFPEYL